MGRRVNLEPVIHFIQFDWEYVLAHLMAFIYGGVIIGYWVFPFVFVLHRLLSYLKKKDAEIFRVLPKSIKGKALIGTAFEIDMSQRGECSGETVKHKSRRSDTTVKSLVYVLKPSISSLFYRSAKGEEK